MAMAGSDRMARQPVGLLWDIENCPVPNDVRSEDVAVNICLALKTHPIVGGPVTVFSAYGDFNQFPRKLREGCQRTGVNLIDVPSGRKDAADKAILVDLFLFAIDHPPPSTIFLISGDVDFSAALHKLSQRGYTVVLAHGAGTGQGVSLALSNAASCVWQWPALARGQGLLPAHSPDYSGDAGPASGAPNEGSPLPPFSFPGSPAFTQTPPWVRGTAARHPSRTWIGPQPSNAPQQRLIPTAALLRSASTVDGSPPSGAPFNGHPAQSEGLAAPQGDLPEGNPKTNPFHHNLLSEAKRGGVAWAAIEADSGRGYVLEGSEKGRPQPVRSVPESSGDGEWARPGDLQGLKAQLVDLLSRNGGPLDLVKVPTEYRKVYGRPLFLAEYGALKLTHLLVRMGDPIAVSGSGLGKKLHFVRTRGPRPSHAARHPPQPQAPGFSSEELSSSGEGEENEQRAVGNGAGQLMEKVGKQAAAETQKERVHAIAPTVSKESSEGGQRLVKETGGAGSTVGVAKVQLGREEDDLLGPFVSMQPSEKLASSIRTGWRESDRDDAGRRRSAERIDVVDLLSGEALEPQSAELWSFEEAPAPAKETDRSQDAGQDASTSPMAWPAPSEESPHERGYENSLAGALVEDEVSGGNSEDEEQAGWRVRARRGSSAPAEAGPGRQPAAYWELLRKKGQASDSGGEQKHGGEARRLVRRRAPGDEAGAVVVSDGDTSPGTPEIAERR